MKKFSVLLICAVIAMVMTACNGESENASSESKNEVSVWFHTSKETAEAKAMQDIVDQFNEENENGYTAKMEFIPRSGSGGGYEDKINAALTTDSLPDVLTLDGPNTAAYAKSGIIAPVGDYISNKDDLLPSIIEQGTYNDKLYAVGYSESSVGIFYNKQMLKDAGVDLSTLPTVEDPWTWKEFKELAATLTEEYDVPAVEMGLDTKSEWLMYAFTPFLWSQGGNIVNDEKTKATGTFNSDKSVQAMNFVQDLVAEGYTTKTPVEKGFQTGKYPLKLTGSWTIAEMANSYPDVEYGVMPYPTSPDTNELVSPSGAWQYAMAASTEKKEAAGAFIDFMTKPENLKKISLENSVLPASKSIIDEVKQEVSPQMQVLIEQNAKSGHARPVLPEYPQVSRVFQQTILDLTYPDKNDDIQKLLDQKAKEIDKALE
ncbi:extracellular solute-binding protein [Pontibacillus yanchengensis]|uniref:Extracellular solute-binding protein n=2 Tax=Pontibacillus yanchengensis TaxID=462910 RepID=A0ACC7VCM5_9BACI|nr:ABC transporter substrate-binding protein [Pontibacillus yanchengensis]MYL32138.1 extracellular solute-binding protein [Pontibacillus yanchengensis]MYL52718.1 extracellular solute-binding protein [Pontibacillus yanchengensis]